MPKQHDYYDFDCGSDIKLVKFAVNSGHFHYIKIDADIANTLDFSGGIGETDTICISGNHLNHFIWPSILGSVRNLYFIKCERLLRLDLSSFSNLEHLAIADCPNLSALTLPNRVRKVELHGVNIKEVDFNRTSMIETINIDTNAAHLTIHAVQRNFLREVWLTLRSQQRINAKGISAELSNNPSLYQIHLNANESPIKLDIKKCYGVTELSCITSGKTSVIGCEDSIALQFLHLTSHEFRLIGADKKSLDERMRKNATKAVCDAENKLASIEKNRVAFYPLISTYHPSPDDKETIIQQSTAGNEYIERGSVKINLLSSMIPQVRQADINDFKIARKAELVGTHQFMRGPSFVIYYLKDSARWKHPERMVKMARHHNDPVISIHEWLLNHDHRKPNILLLTNPHHPAVREFLQQHTKHPKLITWLGMEYHPKINDVILYAGDLDALKTAAPGTANSIVTLPLATIPQNSLSITNDELADMLIDTDMMSKHSKSLEESRVHALDQLASEFTKAYNDLSEIKENQLSESRGNTHSRGQIQIPITPQSLVDGKADSPPDMKGKFTPQVNVRHEPIDPAILIDAHAESPPDMQGKYAPQIQVKHMPINDAVLIDKEASHSTPTLQASPAMQPDEPMQQFAISADTRKQELSYAAPLKPDDSHDQHLLQAATSATEQPELRPQFFDAKATLPTNVPEMRLLEASKKLAVALSEMLDSANTQTQKTKSPELLQASSLINTATQALQRTKHIITTPEVKTSNTMTRDSLFETARELISGLYALSDACTQMNRQPANDLKQQLNTIRHQKK